MENKKIKKEQLFPKLNYLLIFIMCLIGAFTLSPVNAKPVTQDTAQKIAIAFLNQHTGAPISGAFLAYTDFTAAGDPVYYVFNINSNDGFIIVAAEDAASPVLGYTNSGRFKLPPPSSTAGYWLGKRKSEIIGIRSRNLAATREINDQWSGIFSSKNNSGSARMASSSVSPLLTTTWDQSPYYNALCPGSPNSVTGCVATAMAQIMKFWSFPAKGTGSSSYCDCTSDGFTENYGTLSANYGSTTYNWSNMPNNVTSANSDVATLMYHCGVSVHMDYSPTESLSSMFGAPACSQNAYVSYFGYDSTSIRGIYRTLMTYYTDSAWINLLAYELGKGRPVQYMGTDATAGGHCWVCDGYDASDDFFHMNWGFGGLYNGYFSINSLNPGTNDFALDEGALVGIQPLHALPPVSDFMAISATSLCGPGAVLFEDLSSNYATSWSWTFSGGNPSTSGLQNPVIAYSTPGTYAVTLIASNGHGTGSTMTKTGYITVLPTSMPASCIPQTIVIGVQNKENENTDIGISNVTLNTINNNSGSAAGDGGYVNFSCSAYTTLQPSTSYTVNVTVGLYNDEYVNVYIDYNNNGVFTDPGEQVFQGTTASMGLQTIHFVTPASPTTGSYLRMRIMDDISPIQNSCTDLSYGQAEDYGIYFNTVCTESASATVISNEICRGGITGSASVSVNGGTGPYSYFWTGGTTAQTATGLVAGSYVVTVTDNKGCTATSSVNITQPSTIITTSITSTPFNCGTKNGIATVTASGGGGTYHYTWSPGGETGVNTTWTGLGNNVVTVTDNLGCQVTAALSIVSGSNNQYSYASLPIPVILNSDSSYYVVSHEMNCGDQWYDNNTAVTTGAGATIPSPVFANDLSPRSWGFNGTANHSYVPVDFQYKTMSFVTNKTLGTLRNNYSGWVGMEVQVGATPITVNSLGRIFVTGNAGSHSIKIVLASTGQDVPGGSVTFQPEGTNGQYTYVSLQSPITLNANTTYYIVSHEVKGGDQWYDNNTAVTTTSSGTIPSPVFANDLSPQTWALNGNAGHSYGPLDFQYTVTQSNFISSRTLGSLRNNYSGWVGMKVQIGSSQQEVSALGRIYISGNGNAHTLKLVQAGNGQDVAGGAVTIMFMGPSFTDSIHIVPSNCRQSNGSATATALGSCGEQFSYQWSNNAITPAISNLAPGYYTVTITDPNACSISSGITITDIGAGTANASVITNVNCFGGNDGSATVNMTGGTIPYTYKWSSGSTSQTADSLSNNSYMLTVTDHNGCQSNSQVVITALYQLPPVPVITQNGNTLTSTSSSSYQWYLNGAILSGATSQHYIPVSNGHYSVQVTNSNGCTNTSTPYNYDATGLNELSGLTEISLFPNPADVKSILELNLPKQSDIVLEIYSISGLLLEKSFTGKLNEGKNQIELNTLNLASGIYLLRIKSNDDIKSTRFAIVH